MQALQKVRTWPNFRHTWTPSEITSWVNGSSAGRSDRPRQKKQDVGGFNLDALVYTASHVDVTLKATVEILFYNGRTLVWRRKFYSLNNNTSNPVERPAMELGKTPWRLFASKRNFTNFVQFLNEDKNDQPPASSLFYPTFRSRNNTMKCIVAEINHLKIGCVGQWSGDLALELVPLQNQCLCLKGYSRCYTEFVRWDCSYPC